MYIFNNQLDNIFLDSQKRTGFKNFNPQYTNVSWPPIEAGWTTKLKEIVAYNIEHQHELIILSHHGVKLKKTFSYGSFLTNIEEARDRNVDILLGNVWDFKYIVPIMKNKYWIDRFTGSDFIVIFKKLFPKILSDTSIIENSMFDYLSRLTANKLLLYPFLVDNLRDNTVLESKASHKLSVYHMACSRYLYNR